MSDKKSGGSRREFLWDKKNDQTSGNPRSGNDKETGGPAFPIKDWPSKIDKKGHVEKFKCYGGMTLRDYFAAKAMQGIMSSEALHDVVSENEHIIIDGICKIAYQYADAMIKERDNNG